MDIVMPVAGLGTRLRPQTWSKPKPLVPVAGKPMLAHVLDRVLALEPERLVFITGYLGDQIEQWVTQNYDIPSLFVEQTEMRGQTDAIIRIRESVRDDALILFPDALFEADFSGIGRSDADVIMYTKVVEDPSAYGIAVVENDRIVKLVEKPQVFISALAVIGIYYFRSMPDLYDAIDEQFERGLSLKNEYFIADAIQLMIDKGKKVVSSEIPEWRDCGNDETLLDTNRYLLETLQPAAPRSDSVIIQPSFVSDLAVVERSVVGPHASIGPRAHIRDSIVSDSIVDEDALIDGANISSSVVGRGAQVRGRPAAINVSDMSKVALS
ncbi:MAG: NTP transferase domain-containing protein [Thermomicrobiales bacterium]|nr:NTP transferase domain-containing protein [Thermomicrobiales bacterium]